MVCVMENYRFGTNKIMIMKVGKGFYLFFAVIIGFILIACNPKEKIIEKEESTNFNRKEFRSFDPGKSSLLVKTKPFDALQLYLNEVEKQYQSNKRRIDRLQEENSSDRNLEFLKKLFYLNKRNLSLKSQIADSKDLSSSELNLLKTALNLEMNEIDSIIASMEIAEE